MGLLTPLVSSTYETLYFRITFTVEVLCSLRVTGLPVKVDRCILLLKIETEPGRGSSPVLRKKCQGKGRGPLANVTALDSTFLLISVSPFFERYPAREKAR